MKVTLFFKIFIFILATNVFLLIPNLVLAQEITENCRCTMPSGVTLSGHAETLKECCQNVCNVAGEVTTTTQATFENRTGRCKCSVTTQCQTWLPEATCEGLTWIRGRVTPGWCNISAAALRAAASRPAPIEQLPEHYKLTTPTLQIPIPGLLTNFSPAEIYGEPGERYFYVPWIGEYIGAIYKYTLGVIGILAIVIIIWAGIIWLTAAGSAERIQLAKEYISGAIIGLVLAFGSYLILYTLNPDLVKFEAMKLKVIERIDFYDQLSTTTADTSEVGGGCSRQEKQASIQAAYNKFASEIPNWPNSYISDLVPGDRLIVFNANPGPAGLHAAIFMGWAGEGKARVVQGAFGKLVWDGTICLTSACSSPQPLVRVFKASEEGAPPAVPPLSGCPLTGLSPVVTGTGPPITDGKVNQNNLRGKEFMDRINMYLTATTQRGKILQIAQAAVDCQVTLGSCGKTADIINDLAGIPGSGRTNRTHAITKEQSQYLEQIKCHETSP